jgi:DNA relaxase NicK
MNPSPQKTNIDWFSLRSKDDHLSICSTLSDALPEHCILTSKLRKTGFRNFESSSDLFVTDKRGDPDTSCQRIGMAMWGGEAVNGWTLASITGDGCAWVDDWSKVMDVCTGELSRFELKRVDVALDRFDGSHWHEVDAAHAAGEFAPPGAGRPPKAKPIDSRRPEDGRTYYVGSRESSKFYRGYEKGMQILGPQITAASLREGKGFDVFDWMMKGEARAIRLDDGAVSHLEHFHYSDWWRDEVEFKPVNSPLPLDIVENRDQYFAGAFPYLGKVLPGVDSIPLITRRERMPQIELAKLLKIIQVQYGSSLYTALHAHGGDIGAVWDKIIGTKHNKALIEAGVLLVDHG